jgi:hypothetical protein
MNSELHDTQVRRYFIDNKTLSNYQNKAFFCISILSIGTCVYYNYTKSPILFENMFNIITVYAFVDIFYTNYASKLHHLAILNMAMYRYVTNLDQIGGAYIYYSLLKTEFSSIFLALKYWLDKKTLLYKINLMVFYVLFLKLRIIDFYSVILPGSPLYIIDQQYSDNFYMSFIFIGSVYGLYALNIYWFIQMNMLLYKQLFANSIENYCKKYS